jgi:uroporphyrinogen-III synthase
MAPSVAGAGAVLVTRPEPGGAETASRVAALGWQPVLAPALLVQPRRFVIPPVQAVLLTSRAAARALPAPIPGMALLAVGEATAEAARARGWTQAEAAGGTAEELTRLAAARLDPAAGPLLLAVGQGYSLELAAALRGDGFRVIRRIAYVAAPAESLPREARDAVASGQVRYALFHSPRSALCAMSLLRAAGLADAAARMEVLAISRRVADAAAAALAPLAWRGIRIAARPEEGALLDLLGLRDGPTMSGEP